MKKSLVQQLLSTVQDDTGAISSMRIAFLFTWAAVVGYNLWYCHITQTPLSFTEQQMAILGGISGLKLYQNSQEGSTPSVPPSVPPQSPPAATVAPATGA